MVRATVMVAPKRKVMVAEDEAAIAEMLSVALSRYYQVRIVSDGGQVIPSAKEFQPDLILLDVNLPTVDGFWIARTMKGSPVLSKIPIVFLTAQVGSQDVVKGIQVGAKHYLTKPFKVADVLSKIQRLVPTDSMPPKSGPSGPPSQR
jgi:DNA-binding response OmpR family regulator